MYRWVGGVSDLCPSAVGLVLFLDLSNRTLMPECSGEDV